MPIVIFRPREGLHERGADLARLELGGDRARDVEEGEDRGVGEEADQGEEHLPAPAHPGEPVVDESDLQRSASTGAGSGRPSAFMYPAWMARTERSQLKERARARPFSTSCTRSWGSSRMREIAPAVCSPRE